MVGTGNGEQIEGDGPEVETVAFEIGDSAYEVDLSVSEARRLRELYARWIPHARRRVRTSQARLADQV